MVSLIVFIVLGIAVGIVAQLRSEKGKLAWENQLTISRTCQKQGVSYWKYMKNTFNGIVQEALAHKVLACATI